MEQHPIPQNVASYQFRLVGDMTLKQFAELASGILLAWLTLSSKLTPIIKWPVGLGLGFFGFALAFLPVEERPLEIWVKNFFVSIFRPTLYIWHKKPFSKKTLSKKPSIHSQINTGISAKKSKLKLDAYLETVKKTSPQLPIDQFDQNKLDSIQDLLSSLNSLPKTSSLTPAVKPRQVMSSDLPKDSHFGGVRVRRLHSPHEVQKQQIVYQKTAGRQPVAGTIQNRPMILKPSTESSLRPIPVVQAPPLAPPLKVQSLHPDEPSKKASYSKSLQIPIKPDRPNLLAGMVFSADHKPLSNAILEIKNNRNETVRALKTNKLGQFFTATPLPKGAYRLYIEHSDWSFDIIGFEVKGKIIDPLEITASKGK